MVVVREATDEITYGYQEYYSYIYAREEYASLYCNELFYKERDKQCVVQRSEDQSAVKYCCKNKTGFFLECEKVVFGCVEVVALYTYPYGIK